MHHGKYVLVILCRSATSSKNLQCSLSVTAFNDALVPGHAVPNCSGFKSGVPDVSLSDILLAFLRFEIAADDDDGTRFEADCFKRILCEMNSVVVNRNEGGAELGNLFSEFGTFAVLQNQNVLAPSESLLRAARTGRLLAGPGKCSRIYDSCSRWEELTNKAELLWLQKSK